MSVEALWTVEYGVSAGWTNGGVIVLETSRIFGGDSSFYYIGRYDLTEETIKGDLNVVHYHGNQLTAWGDKVSSFSIRFSGKLKGEDFIEGRMNRSGMSDLPFRMQRRTSLP